MAVAAAFTGGGGSAGSGASSGVKSFFATPASGVAKKDLTPSGASTRVTAMRTGRPSRSRVIGSPERSASMPPANAGASHAIGGPLTASGQSSRSAAPERIRRSRARVAAT